MKSTSYWVRINYTSKRITYNKKNSPAPKAPPSDAGDVQINTSWRQAINLTNENHRNLKPSSKLNENVHSMIFQKCLYCMGILFFKCLISTVEDFCIMHWLQKMQFKGSWLVEQKPTVIKLK